MARNDSRPRRSNEILSQMAASGEVVHFCKIYHPVYGLPLEMVEELETDYSVLEEFMDRAVMDAAEGQWLKDRDELLGLLGLDGVEMAKSFYAALVEQGHIVETPQGLRHTDLCAASVARGKKIYPAWSKKRLYVEALDLQPLTREYQPGLRLTPYSSAALFEEHHRQEGTSDRLLRDGLPLDLFDERVVLSGESLERIFNRYSGVDRLDRNLPQKVSRVVLNGMEPLEQYFAPYYFVSWADGRCDALDYGTGEPSPVFSPLLRQRSDIRGQILRILTEGKHALAQALEAGKGERERIPLRNYPRSMQDCFRTGYLDQGGNLHFRVTEEDLEALLGQLQAPKGADALYDLYKYAWLSCSYGNSIGCCIHPVLEEGQLDRIQEALLRHRNRREDVDPEEDRARLARSRRRADSGQELERVIRRQTAE